MSLADLANAIEVMTWSAAEMADWAVSPETKHAVPTALALFRERGRTMWPPIQCPFLAKWQLSQ